MNNLACPTEFFYGATESNNCIPGLKQRKLEYFIQPEYFIQRRNTKYFVIVLLLQKHYFAKFSRISADTAQQQQQSTRMNTIIGYLYD